MATTLGNATSADAQIDIRQDVTSDRSSMSQPSTPTLVPESTDSECLIVGDEENVQHFSGSPQVLKLETLMSTNETCPVKGTVIREYEIQGIVSNKGRNGIVLSCIDYSNRLYAMKVENRCDSMKLDNTALSQIHSFNQQASELYIPQLRDGFREQSRRVVVMELLGPDVATLHKAMDQKPMSMKTTMQIALSALTAYEQIHKAGWLHLTTKPINFCVGGTIDTCHKIYAIDFGRAQRYRVGARHRPKSPFYEYYGKDFSSLWSDRCTPSRRDDIMSLALMLIYLFSSSMPWQNDSLLGYISYLQAKKKFDNGKLNLYEKLLIYSSLLSYEEEPAYEEWRIYIRKKAVMEHIELDGKFDWDDRLHQDETRRIVLKE